MDINQAMQDPKFRRMLAQQSEAKAKKKMQEMLNGGGSFEELAKMFPKLQQAQEQDKVRDAEMKVMNLKKQNLYKRSESAFNAAQQQQQPVQ